jgi:hypothetical protein
MRSVLASDVPRIILMTYISTLEELDVHHPAMESLIQLRQSILSNKTVDYDDFVCPDPLLTVLLSMNEFTNESDVNASTTKRFSMTGLIPPTPIKRESPDRGSLDSGRLDSARSSHKCLQSPVPSEPSSCSNRSYSGAEIIRMNSHESYLGSQRTSLTALKRVNEVSPKPISRDEPVRRPSFQRLRSDSVSSFPSYSAIPLYPYNSDSSVESVIMRPESFDSTPRTPDTCNVSEIGSPVSE